MPRCKKCSFQGPIEDFKACRSVYHDMSCPECHTTAVDTTDVFDAWAADGKTYGYGKNNVLNTSKGSG